MKKVFFVRNDFIKGSLFKYLWDLPPDAEYKVVVSDLGNVRSISQNALMHMWFAAYGKFRIQSDGFAMGSKGWKVFFKDMFLGYEVVELPYGKKVTQLRSTKDLSVKEMTEFLQNIDHYCGSEGCILPHPDEYNIAMGIK